MHNVKMRTLSCMLSAAIFCSTAFVFSGCNDKQKDGSSSDNSEKQETQEDTKETGSTESDQADTFDQGFSYYNCTSEVIGEDEPWYEASVLNYSEILDISEYDFCEFQDNYFIGDKVISLYKGCVLALKTDVKMCVVDSDGELIRDDMIGDPENGNVFYLGSKEIDGKVAVYYFENSFLTDPGVYKLVYDPLSDTLEDPVKFEGKMPDCAADNGYLEGDYLAFSYYDLATNTNGLVVFKDEKIFTSFNLLDLCNYYNNAYLYYAEEDGEDLNMIIDCDGNYYDLILTPEGEYTYTPNKEYDGLVAYDSPISDGHEYTCGVDGIYMDNKPYVMFYDCDINFDNLNFPYPIGVSDDMIILRSDKTSDYDPYNQTLIVLRKQDTNPNKGKKVISALFLDFTTYPVLSNGVYNFNKENGEYFIKLHGFYSEQENESSEYFEEFYNFLNSEYAPDMVFQADRYINMNNKDFFIDLSEIDIDQDLYFNNIIDGVKEDGALYCLPLDFGIEGFMIEKDLTGIGNSGFTFEEYERFSTVTFDDYDFLAMSYTKCDYFRECLKSMNDLWFHDGKVDFHQEEFEELYKFFTEFIPKHTAGDYMSGSVGIMEVDESKPVFYHTLLSSYDGFWDEDLKDPGLYGFPTADGRSAPFTVMTSISITKNTDKKDECIKLLRYLLSPEIQETSIYIPILRSATEKLIEENTPDQKDNILGAIESTSHCYPIYNYELDMIVSDVAEEGFGRNFSLSEFQDKLEEEVQKYLDEH